jgi:hypothetical protein
MNSPKANTNAEFKMRKRDISLSQVPFAAFAPLAIFALNTKTVTHQQPLGHQAPSSGSTGRTSPPLASPSTTDTMHQSSRSFTYQTLA